MFELVRQQHIGSEFPLNVYNYVFGNVAFRRGYGSSVNTPASPHEHHAYPGGLAVHTEEVLETCLAMVGWDYDVHLDVIIPAAIFHDFCKVKDYDNDGQKQPYYNLVRHVAGSYAHWMHATTELKIQDQEWIDAVGHAILAHHGRPEWGSPVTPQTREAMILHAADNYSAKFGPGRFLMID